MPSYLLPAGYVPSKIELFCLVLFFVLNSAIAYSNIESALVISVSLPSLFAASGTSHFEHLCNYLSLPNNLICLFQENKEIMKLLIER